MHEMTWPDVRAGFAEPIVRVQLMECPAEDDYITSVAWAADGKHVSVGTSSAQVQVGSEVVTLCQKVLIRIHLGAQHNGGHCWLSSYNGMLALAVFPAKAATALRSGSMHRPSVIRFRPT